MFNSPGIGIHGTGSLAPIGQEDLLFHPRRVRAVVGGGGGTCRKQQKALMKVKVDELQASLLSSPLPQPLRRPVQGGQVTIYKRDCLLVRARTNQGQVGYGVGAPSPNVAQLINRNLRAAVVGLNPGNLSGLRRKVFQRRPRSIRAWCRPLLRWKWLCWTFRGRSRGVRCRSSWAGGHAAESESMPAAASTSMARRVSGRPACGPVRGSPPASWNWGDRPGRTCRPSGNCARLFLRPGELWWTPGLGAGGNTGWKTPRGCCGDGSQPARMG